MKIFRLHGDNIIECERIANLLLSYCSPRKIERGFTSPSCPYIIISATHPLELEFKLEFFPGFNKSRNDRWKSNILDILKSNGCFLDETPDIILTELKNDRELIIAALEFCSALQAGNQAWQRSGRAYSVGRTNCPYIYILDFVKYELDSTTRQRKALRFPNPAVAYSYLSYSKRINNLVTQAYVKAEEFQPTFDEALTNFPLSIFGEKEIAEFLLLKMLDMDTSGIEQSLLHKNADMVKFLATDTGESFDSSDWDKLISSSGDVIQYSKEKSLTFKKKIAEKSVFGHAKEFRDICTRFAIGIASSDLPFGLIPAENRHDFAKAVIELYSITDESIKDFLAQEEDLAVCILKGFKPHGDDNRPDRGALPFLTMLLNENINVLTFLFGPIVASTETKLADDYKKLYSYNGLWKAIIGISDLIVVDSPCVNSTNHIEKIINNSQYKRQILNNYYPSTEVFIPPTPNHYQENDVDAVLHYLFKHLLSEYSFEGMCNPPGGDWSGLSILFNNHEYRWLSLPRVSADGKRPDHVVELFGFGEASIILTVESKESPLDLEDNIGIALKTYLHHLFAFKPSVSRGANNSGSWQISNERCDFSNCKFVSVGAFLKDERVEINHLFERTKCDILMSLQPNDSKNCWSIEIYCNKQYKQLGEYIKSKINDESFIIINVN